MPQEVLRLAALLGKRLDLVVHVISAKNIPHSGQLPKNVREILVESELKQAQILTSRSHRLVENESVCNGFIIRSIQFIQLIYSFEVKKSDLFFMIRIFWSRSLFWLLIERNN